MTMQFVGQTKGKTPDELVDEFVYPQFFKENFDLREQYGKVSWSIRNVYNGYLGFLMVKRLIWNLCLQRTEVKNYLTSLDLNLILYL